MKRNRQLAINNRQRKRLCLLLSIFLLSLNLFSQKEKKYIENGNVSYDKKKYNEAEKEYSNALKKNKESYNGSFNLGDAYYKQKKYTEAAEQFQSLTHRATSKDTLAKAYHNLGNSLMQQKKYQEALDAYKNSLKNDSKDEDARYNYSYAQQMLRQEQKQQQQKQDNKDNKDKKDDKKQEQKNKNDKNKEGKDKKEEKQNQEKQEKQQEKQAKEKQEQQKISKEDAQRLLDALQNDEKNLHDKVKKGKLMQGNKGKPEKDW